MLCTEECVWEICAEWIDEWESSSTVKVKVTQSCPTFCDPMDYGILQATILEWVAIPLSRRSSQPRDQTQSSCIADGFFTRWATREDQEYWSGSPIPSPVDLWPQYSHLDFTIHQLVTLENYLTFLLGLPPAKTGELWAFITLLWHWDDFMPAKYFLKAFMWWMISNYTFYFIFSLRKHL